MSNDDEKKPHKSPRHRAREIALQAVYQWRLTNDDILEIENQLLSEKNLGYFDKTLFARLLRGTLNQIDELEALLAPQLDRPLIELSPVEYAVLMLGTFELRFHTEAPYRVIINEAVELAKTFGGNDGHKYVNGVLDKLAPELRADEVAKKRHRN